MVFGFLKGKIEVSLDNYNYSFGDTVKGTVRLKLNKPTPAREMRIFLRADQRATQHSLGAGIPLGTSGISIGGSSRSGSRNRTTVNRVFDFKLPLDGEKTYQNEEYPFEIKIPQAQQQNQPEGLVGNLVGAANLLSGRMTNVNWYLEANLDVPGGFDVGKKVQVNVG